MTSRGAGVVGLAGLLLLGLPAVSRPAAPLEPPTFRVCFTSGMFVDINVNDAHAAVAAWAQAVLKQAGVNMDAAPVVAESMEQVTGALRQGTIDAVVLLAQEYFAVPVGLLASDAIYANASEGSPYEQYVILVRTADPVTRLADLKGRDLIVLRHMRTGLLVPWLETELDRQGQRGVDTFFSHVTHATQLSQVILPVFFSQSAACLVTRKGYLDMVELNPQIGQQLRVLATSPPFAPGFLCFRAGFKSADRDRIERAIQRIHATPAGRQVLAVFKGESITRLPISALASDQLLLSEFVALQKRRAIKVLPFYARAEATP